MGLRWPAHYSEWEMLVEANKRTKIESPRASWKTYFFSLAWPLWRILRDKTEVLFVSDSEDQARKNLRLMRETVETNDLLAPLRPSTKELWGVDHISFPNQSYASIMGFGTSKRGTHPDIIINDDIEAENNKMSRGDKDRIYFGVISGMTLPQTIMVTVGTPMEFGDILHQLDNNEAYVKWRRPALIDGKNQFPDIWTDDWLAFRRQEMGSINFSREMLLERIDPATQPFKRDFETLYDVLPDGNFAHTITVCDPAYTEGDGDYTAIITVKFTHGNHAYIAEAKRFRREDPGVIVDELFKTIATQEPDGVGLPRKKGEAVAYTFEERRTRENRWDFRYVQLPENQGKAHKTRIGGLVPRWEARSIHVHRNMKDLLEEIYQFRLDDSHKHDDMCFAAGTMIATPIGDRPIESLNVGDQVITPFGYRHVLACGLTGERETVNKYGLSATGNHPIFTNDGFKPIGDLPKQFKGNRLSLRGLIIWRYRKLLNSITSHSASWEGRDAIISAKRIPIKGGKILKDFMWRFGNFITSAQFPKAITFTIKTGTLLITTSLIWTVYRLSNIGRSLTVWIWNKSGEILTALGLWHQHGTAALRDINGTWQNPESNGLIPINSLAFVSGINAPKCSFRFIEMPFIARTHVNKQSAVSMAGITSQNHANVAERNSQRTNFKSSDSVHTPVPSDPHGRLEKVYNLTIERDHVYFANGLLVSNCDALAHCFNPELAKPNTGKKFVPNPETTKQGKAYYGVGITLPTPVSMRPYRQLMTKLDRRIGEEAAA
jgi:Hint domain